MTFGDPFEDSGVGCIPHRAPSSRRYPRRAEALEPAQKGTCKATWKKEFKLPWREAGPPHHYDDMHPGSGFRVRGVNFDAREVLVRS